MCNAFRHSSFNHLSNNMAGLLIFGGYLEMACGWRRFLSGYFLCLLGSKALWQVMDGRPSIGSSGAVYGLMGMALCIYYYRHEAEIKRALMNFLMKVDTQQRAMLTFAYLVMFLDVIIPQPNVAGWAHAGGFFTGLILSGLMVIPSASYGQLQKVSGDPREEISS
ncbi:MAG: rhomboid family intramembrane serine protease [Nitrospiraceae bacterium]|nr:rhomboid family intramembrane serine protease [Nitrospiraceae bacterium]